MIRHANGMSLLMLAPFSSGPSRGNLVTVSRTVRILRQEGLSVVVADCQQSLSADQLTPLIMAEDCRLIHGFHAYHTGLLAYDLYQRSGLPYILTITGSDLFDPLYRDHVGTIRAVQAAARIICFDKTIAVRVAEAFAIPMDNLCVIPQSVDWYPDDGERYRSSRSGGVILLPAALRPVKGVCEAIQALAPIAESLSFELLVAGGDIDAEYGDAVRRAAEQYHFVKVLGDVPHDQMGYYYRGADIVLNSSWFEGGLPNGIIEALAMGCPVVARDIVGNRAAIRDGVDGSLFHSDEELQAQIVRLLSNRDHMRGERTARADFARQRFSPAREASELLACYREVLTLPPNTLF